MSKCIFFCLLFFVVTHVFSEEVPTTNDREWLGYIEHLSEAEIQWLEVTLRRLEEKDNLGTRRGLYDQDEDEDDLELEDIP